MAEKQVPKGRGALIEMLKKYKEAKAGIEEQQPELPPKNRGRAALLQKIQQMKEKKVGLGSEQSPQSSVSSIPERLSAAGKGEAEQLSEEIGEMNLAASSEPVMFKGQSGTPIRATANYIHLEVENNSGMYMYEVRFNPDIDAKSNRYKLVNEALGSMATTKVYDGDAVLYLPSQIFDKKEFNSVIPSTDNPVTVTLIYKHKRKMNECIHFYNVLFKRIMYVLLYKQMGRNYFSPDHKQIIPQHKLEVLPGFAVHVDEMEGGLMVCLDTQHRVIRSQTVYELFQEIRAANPRTFRSEAQKNIIGSCVLTKYNNKTYTVDDIDWDAKPTDTFETKSGPCNYVDYYRQHHNIDIEDVEQPLLVVKSSRKVNNEKQETLIALIPELSFLTGLTDVMRSDFKIMKDVAIYTRVTPNQRALALRIYLDRVRQSPEAQQILKNWGLKLANGTTELDARVLPQEAIYFGGPHAEERKFINGTDWSRAISDNVMTGPIDIVNWQLYYTRRDQKYAANFAETIVRLAKGMGCIIRNPQHIILDDDRTETYMTSIRNNVSNNVQVAVFICPTIRADRYSIIKKMCCINNPIASQVILSKTLANPQKVRTIIHKIGMQITCKLGGTLWCVKIPVSNWMICGIDVYHGANKQSVCGFVASINDSLTKYYSEAVFQDGEIGDFFKVSFRRSLIQQKERTGCFPIRVVIFRDGVGDGQLEHCRRYEISQFQHVIKELNINTSLTYIIVQKRISTRIFKAIDDNNYENPPSGTIVDSTVTRRHLADFFLVPQSVKQGTVNPTHYIVLHDDGNIKPDHLQRLAYKLCHLYYNWTGTIRVPAPCLYAHKLAALVGQYIKKIPDNQLNDKLYYL